LIQPFCNLRFFCNCKDDFHLRRKDDFHSVAKMILIHIVVAIDDIPLYYKSIKHFFPLLDFKERVLCKLKRLSMLQEK